VTPDLPLFFFRVIILQMTDRLQKLAQLHAADPADPFCTYGIALEHAKAGRAAEALVWLEKTLTLDPHYSYAYYQKAKVLSQQGQTAQAKAVLQIGMTDAAQTNTPDAKHAHAEMRTLLEALG